MTWHVAIKQSKLKPGQKKMLTVAKQLILIGQTDETYFATEARAVAIVSSMIDGLDR